MRRTLSLFAGFLLGAAGTFALEPHIQLVGRYTPGFRVQAAAAAGDYLFLTGWDPGSVWNYAASQTIVPSYGVLNLRDRARPRQAGMLHFPQAELSPYTGVFVQFVRPFDHYVYSIESFWPGRTGGEPTPIKSFLHIHDVTTPAEPRWIGSVETGADVRALAASAGYVYVAHDYYEENPGEYKSRFSVIDVRDPARLRHVGFYDSPHQFTAIAVANGAVWVAVNDRYGAPGRVQLMDLGDPTTPKSASSYSFAGYPLNFVITESIVCVAETVCTTPECLKTEDRLSFLRITNGTNLITKGIYKLSGRIQSTALSGNRAYIIEVIETFSPSRGTTYRGVLNILDLADLSNPRLIGTRELPCDEFIRPSAFAIIPLSSQVLVIDWHMVHTIDITQPATPVLTNSYPVASHFSLRISGPLNISGRVQRSYDLRHWSDWSPVTFAENPLELSDFDNNRFFYYRVVVP